MSDDAVLKNDPDDTIIERGVIMELLGLALIGIGGIGVIINAIRKESKSVAAEKERQERRRNIPCQFQDGLSISDFEVIVRRAGKIIHRIKAISITGPTIYCSVRSQSGITDWNFELDFNDYGHITGNYWIRTENEDSNIPKRLGDLISSAIKDHYSFL